MIQVIFLDRSPEREVRHLDWRVRFFGAGAALALVGMALDLTWLIWIATGVLLVGFLLRFVPQSSEEGTGVPEPGGGGIGGVEEGPETEKQTEEREGSL